MIKPVNKSRPLVRLRLALFSLFALVYAALSGTLAQAATPSTASQEKVLRYAFPIAETGFDPAQLSDLYSRILTANIFDSLYTYDYLARPAKIKPNLAQDMPEVSEDFKTFTVRLRPGIYFADDPALGAKSVN